MRGDETSGALLLLGGIILLARKVITWHIPVSYIGTVGLLALAYYSLAGYPGPPDGGPSPMFSPEAFSWEHFFMATDMVTSPVTGKGMILFRHGLRSDYIRYQDMGVVIPKVCPIPYC